MSRPSSRQRANAPSALSRRATQEEVPAARSRRRKTQPRTAVPAGPPVSAAIHSQLTHRPYLSPYPITIQLNVHAVDVAGAVLHAIVKPVALIDVA